MKEFGYREPRAVARAVNELRRATLNFPDDAEIASIPLYVRNNRARRGTLRVGDKGPDVPLLTFEVNVEVGAGEVGGQFGLALPTLDAARLGAVCTTPSLVHHSSNQPTYLHCGCACGVFVSPGALTAGGGRRWASAWRARREHRVSAVGAAHPHPWPPPGGVGGVVLLTPVQGPGLRAGGPVPRV